ncbi:MAG: ABC transporter substrate-binding protein, partial [candidate division NC10 bacterium]|nr:ABC transporter substrate-binding protein [candidate division NC10 bacterium]
MRHGLSRHWVGLIGLGLLLGLLLGGAPAPAEAQEYRIGFVSAVTGPASSLGVPERDVAVMLQKVIDARGGVTGPDGVKHPVKILINDDQSKVDETVKAVKRLIDDQVQVVIASSQSPTSLAVASAPAGGKSLVEEAKVPHISMASSHAIV